jgi:TolA-binding protein
LSKGGNANAALTRYEKFLAQTNLGADAKKYLPAARLGAGRALVANGDWTRAESTLRAGLTGASGAVGAEMNYQLAQALAGQNKWTEAAAQGLKVSTLYPQSEWASRAAWLAAEATEKGGDKTTALELYRAIAAKNGDEFASQAQGRIQALGG